MNQKSGGGRGSNVSWSAIPIGWLFQVIIGELSTIKDDDSWGVELYLAAESSLESM